MNHILKQAAAVLGYLFEGPRYKILLCGLLFVQCPSPILAATGDCSSRSTSYSDMAQGGAGYSLPACQSFPAGQWQAMEDEAEEECGDSAADIVAAHALECLAFCTTDVDSAGNSVSLHCLPLPTFPPLPPAACGNIIHNINSSSYPQGCGFYWHYNFVATAWVTTRCNCIPNPSPPVIQHGSYPYGGG